MNRKVAWTLAKAFGAVLIAAWRRLWCRHPSERSTFRLVAGFGYPIPTRRCGDCGAEVRA